MKYSYIVKIIYKGYGLTHEEYFDYFSNALKRKKSLIEHFGKNNVYIQKIKRTNEI